MHKLTYRPLANHELPLLHEWLARPHVAEWWGAPATFTELEQDYAPAIAGTIPHSCYLAIHNEMPVGFIQSYVATGWHHEGWWLDEHDQGVWGIDQFLANQSQLGQGLGTAMVSGFVRKLFENPEVTRIQTDPAPDNGRAIRCYEKAGFRAVSEIDTPDGRALLMHCERQHRAT